MPRNACTECRLRKIKCIANDSRSKCERCKTKNLPCSYIQSLRSATIDGGIRKPERPNILPNTYKLSNVTAGLDIGSGTPTEILREGELTQSLLLLYFSNFSDIHFMFDQDLFLRQYALGDAPKIILFAMMALGIRYSHAPFLDQASRSHRGEPLYRQAKQLLKDEFDHPSPMIIQAYTLLSTYHLTFGGSRKAWLYLSIAGNMIKILRILEDNWNADPLQSEMTKRLVCTVALMDRILSPSLRVPSVFVPDDPIPDICTAEELQLIKHMAPTEQNPDPIREIMVLSRLFSDVAHYYRYGGPPDQLEELGRQLEQWSASLPQSLKYTVHNLEAHRDRYTLRKFAFMHLLYHHISQLTLFQFLKGNSVSTLMVQACYGHAQMITDIVQYAWEAGFDMHNASIGQILTIAAAVHTHCLLTTSSVEAMEASQARIQIVRDCFERVKQHCRLFNWISAHLETFLRICGQSSSLFDKNPNLIRQMLHLGTAYERLNPMTAGHIDGLEALKDDAYPEVLTDDYINKRTNESEDLDHAWMFSDASLLNLYTMPDL